MNSYPPELLAQLAPVMFVAGLDAQPEGQTSQSQDPFVLLKQRLRDALTSQRKVEIYQPDKSKTFQVVLVNKDVNFPPRKIPPQDDPHGVAHSPLSPLTPSSPLHPDGLIAPIWIRKHTALVPSVFVLFMRIFESPPHQPKSPLDPPDPEREQEEHRKDAELAMDIAMRKKSTNERSIKLTVVLIASRRLLDDPSLDSRLTYIRRQSGLDSRAALFVLSPVSTGELIEFVASLQQALFDSALDYYTNHSKRVRRKRNRHTQAVSSYQTLMAPLANANVARPLRPEGWTVRYEYKMACFAEFRGEDEVALKHYQDAYSMLCIMFGSPVILPPRTKRWAEAKVLADCINIKVTKLYLYNNEHALALSHHSAHVRQFGDFSRGWGIGEETFEFWSWVSRQHRILAELLEQGTQSTLVIPRHQPSPLVTSSSTTSTNLAASKSQLPLGTLEMETARSMGINPSHALQHPGFYYYLAAKCAESRKERFQVALQAEAEGRLSSTSPGFVNEKKVDHSALRLELYTKSYELFKKYASQEQPSPSVSRLTLWIANRIAQTYYESGKYDMAVKFFERIAKVFRKEQWGALLQPLLSTWYKSAQQLGDMDLSVKLLLERIAQGSDDPEETAALEDDLLAVLQTTVPSSNDTVLTVDSSESIPLFNTSLIFWTPEVTVGQSAAFQLILSTPSTISLANLPFTTLKIVFSEPSIPPITIHHSDDGEEGRPSLRLLQLGNLPRSNDSSEVKTTLRWSSDSTLVITGTLSLPTPAVSVSVTHLHLKLEQANWKIELILDPSTTRLDSIPEPKWLRSTSPPRFLPMSKDRSSVTFRNRPRTLNVSVSHMSPAYLDEAYPLTVEAVNTDNEDVELTLNVLLQPTPIDYAMSTIKLDEQSSSGLIQAVPLGILKPGLSVRKTLTLISTGASGDRMLDISVQSRPPGSYKEKENEDSTLPIPELDVTEILKTITVPVVDPLKATFDIAYARMPGERTAIADLRSFEGDYWAEGDGTETTITTTLQFLGPWAVEVKDVKLRLEDNPKVKFMDSSTTPEDGDFPAEYFSGDQFCDVSRLVLAPPEDSETEIVSVAEPGHFVVTWSKLLEDGSRGPLSTTMMPLPPLEPAMESLTALLSAPAAARLHVPFTLSITVRNRHSTKSANIVVQMHADPTDSFILAGLRSGRLPILLPDSEETLTWRVIPVECGYVKLPRITVRNMRPAVHSSGSGAGEEASGEGEPVKVVRSRAHHRPAKLGSEEVDESDHGLNTLLVLPA